MTLLIFLLKARRPEKYKDRVSTEHSGTAHKTFEQWLGELTGPGREAIDRALEQNDHDNATPSVHARKWSDVRAGAGCSPGEG
jgi:hypothetical protein